MYMLWNKTERLLENFVQVTNGTQKEGGIGRNPLRNNNAVTILGDIAR